MVLLKNRRWIFLFVLVSSFLLLSACQPATSTPEPEPPPKPDPDPEPVRETIVHIAGWGDASNGAFPCYWQDKQKTDLSVCLYPGPVKAEGYAHSVFVSGKNVYVAGFISCHGKRIACYWKNGARTELKHRAGSAYANSIFISEKIIYVAGRIEFQDRAIPCYWKNGVYTELSLSSPNVSAMANAIFVSGSDVYIAGTYNIEVGMNPKTEVPCYWKNGERTNLSVLDPTHDGYGNSIFVSEGNVYVAGYVVDGTNAAVPCYWLNGARTDLSRLIVYSGWANSIHVSGSDVYIGGVTQSESCELVPCYWKNGTRTDLSVVSPGKGGWVNCLFVLGSNVFAAGYSGFDPNQGADFAVPCYWKNGVRTDLKLGIYPGAFANAIYVTYK